MDKKRGNLLSGNQSKIVSELFSLARRGHSENLVYYYDDDDDDDVTE